MIMMKKHATGGKAMLMTAIMAGQQTPVHPGTMHSGEGGFDGYETRQWSSCLHERDMLI